MPASFRFSSPDTLMNATGISRRIAARNVTAERLNELCGNDLVVGALPFHPHAATRLFVPREHTRTTRTNRPTDAVAAREDAPSQRGTATLDGFEERGNFHHTVTQALTHIDRGEVDKIVVGRQVIATLNRPANIDAVTRHLWDTNPHAFGYRLSLDAPWLLGHQGLTAPITPPPGVCCTHHVPAHEDDDAHLIGASPELVLKVRGRQVTTFPLAGSLPRSADPAEDARRADYLASSAKNLAEHAHVTRAIADTLGRLCTTTDIPTQPDVVATPVIWHLGTKMTGTLAPGVTSWDLLAALHPTPAVSGWPSHTATRLIRSLEPTPRGVFAGVVGWCDRGGDCDWAMTLRGGIVHGRTAYAFAGAGIVAGSDPEEEVRETTTKLSTFIGPLLRVAGSPADTTPTKATATATSTSSNTSTTKPKDPAPTGAARKDTAPAAAVLI